MSKYTQEELFNMMGDLMSSIMGNKEGGLNDPTMQSFLMRDHIVSDINLNYRSTSDGYSFILSNFDVNLYEANPLKSNLAAILSIVNDAVYKNSGLIDTNKPTIGSFIDLMEFDMFNTENDRELLTLRKSRELKLKISIYRVDDRILMIQECSRISIYKTDVKRSIIVKQM